MKVIMTLIFALGFYGFIVGPVSIVLGSGLIYFNLFWIGLLFIILGILIVILRFFLGMVNVQ